MTLALRPPAGLDDEGFARVVRLARDWAGLDILPQKRTMVETRLAKQVRRLGLSGFGPYLDHVESATQTDDRAAFVEALTTNVTQFFREPHHFDLLRDAVLPRLLAGPGSDRGIRIWSAGCSTGQEPYSIAVTVLAAIPDAARRDIRILATDIDRGALAACAAGRYPLGQIDAIPPAARGFARTLPGEEFEFDRAVRSLVTFRQLNLHADWPMRNGFDVVFCRNVAIYFDATYQARLWGRFVDQIRPGGHLFLGHSERLPESLAARLEPVGVTAYRKHSTGLQRQDASHGPS